MNKHYKNVMDNLDDFMIALKAQGFEPNLTTKRSLIKLTKFRNKIKGIMNHSLNKVAPERDETVTTLLLDQISDRVN